jgi:hypothetical protein
MKPVKHEVITMAFTRQVLFEAKTDEDRLELLYAMTKGMCLRCGALQEPCYCWNDE